MTTYNYTWPGANQDPLPSPWEISVNNGLAEQNGSNGVRFQNDGASGDYCYMEQQSIDAGDTNVQLPITWNVSGTQRQDIRIQICTTGELQTDIGGTGDTETDGNSYEAFMRLGNGTIHNASIYKTDNGSALDQSTELLDVDISGSNPIVIEFDRTGNDLTLTIWDTAMENQIDQTTLADSSSPLGTGYVSVGMQPEDLTAKEITLGQMTIVTDEVVVDNELNPVIGVDGDIAAAIVANIG